MKILLFILLIILLIVIALALWLLIAQVIITIDSNRKLYEFQVKGIGRARLRWISQTPIIDARILFWQKKINPFDFSITKKQKSVSPKKEKKKPKKSKTAKEYQEMAMRILRTFRLEKFRLNLDTDSYYYNSLLYPLFFFANKKNIKMNINYQGQTELTMVVKNRPIRILYALYF